MAEVSEGVKSGSSEPAVVTAPADPLEVIAYVHGQPYTELPKDLYIPPEALEVMLEAFEGPLDLLLYLIKKNNLDVLEIPVAEITRQYVQYIELMHAMQFELAAEYLVMAAMLGEIKSSGLLPRLPTTDDDEADPRQELIRRLQEYECFKLAAQELDQLPRVDRDLMVVCLSGVSDAVNHAALEGLPQLLYPEVSLRELLLALKEVAERAQLHEHHQIQREKLSIRERMTLVLDRLATREFMVFVELFWVEEGKEGVVVTFLALLELLKEGLVEAVQHEPYSSIYVSLRITHDDLSVLE